MARQESPLVDRRVHRIRLRSHHDRLDGLRGFELALALVSFFLGPGLGKCLFVLGDDFDAFFGKCVGGVVDFVVELEQLLAAGD